VLKSGLSGPWPALGLVATLTLAGCAETPGGGPLPPPAAPPPPAAAQNGIFIATPFRAEDFAWSTMPGSAHIRGMSAPAQSCSGSAVALTPDTPYSRERIAKLYGSTEYAVVPTAVVRAKVIVNDNPAVRGFVRGARCDSTGNFAFDNLPAGSFFVIAEVGDPSGPKVVMRRVTTVAGRVLQVPLTGTAPGPRRPHRRATGQ
jgi:hypothetical protein